MAITTSPPGARISVADENGKIVWEGTSPAEALLKLGNGYFDGQTFTVTARLAGYENAVVELDTDLCMWYLIGNFGFGGLIGYLIVDPLTGSMWDLQDTMPVIQLTPQAEPMVPAQLN